MIKNLILLLVLMSAFCAHAGTGAIPSGENIKLLKDNLRFKTTDTKIMTNDSDDPTSVAKDAEIGSMYIRSTTGVLYQKQDSGSSTNWLPLLIGPAGSGTDNRIVRWNGTGVPLVQDSLVTLDDLGALSGLTQLDVDNVQINGNTILTTDTNGDLTLDPDGTGKVVINSDLDVLGTITNISASTLTVTNATITANDGGNQATADSLDSGLIVEMSDAADATLHYDSTVASRWKAGEIGSTSEIITATHAQDITAKTLLEVDNIQINGNTIASTDTNGNVIINPNGTGGVNFPDLTVSQPAYINASGNLVSQDIDLTTDVSGVLPVANGGTGVDSSLASNGQLLIGNGTGFSIANLTGTADQVSVTNGSGTITLATPQSIATTSSPSFTGLTLSGLTQNSVPYIGASGVLTEDNPSFTYNGSTLSLSNAGSATLLNLDQTGSGTSLNIDNSGSGDFVIVDTDALVVQASKEVGIGIANPTSTLHVIGDAQVDDININATSISVTSTNDDLNISSNGTGDVNVNGTSVYLNTNTRVSNAVISGTSDINPLTLLGAGERVVVSDPLEFSNSTPATAAASGRTKIAVNSSGVPVKLNEHGVQRPIDNPVEADLLLNRSFEDSYSGSDALNWTLSGATGTITTASSIDGTKHLSLSLSSTLSLSQEITATQYNPNVVSFSLWVKSSLTDLQLCGTLATVEQECVDYDGSDQWKKLQVLVTAPSSGAMGLKLKSLTSTSGTVLVDAGEFSSDPLKFKNQEIMTDWESYTPTFTGFGTPSSESFKYRRVGDSVEVYGFFISGTVSASVASISLPSGLLINTSKLVESNNTASSGQRVGEAQGTGAVNHNFAIVTAPLTSDSVIYFGSPDSSTSQLLPQNGNSLIATGEKTSFYFKVPIEGWSATQSQILTANDVVSSDTINWAFKATAIVDSDPVGTYNTYSKGSSSNTFTICGTAPTTLPNNSDGFYLDAVPYSSASNCTTSIAKAVVKIGKGLKGYSVSGYESANKTGIVDVNYFLGGSTEEVGVKSTYSETLGTLDIDAGIAYQGTNTTRHFGSKISAASYVGIGYVHFAASKNPVISALDAIPKIDYSWENEFSAKIQNDGTCAVLTENYDFVASCNRSATGVGTVTFVSGHFTQAPSVVVTTATTSDDTIAVGSVTTSGFSFESNTTAGAKVDRDFFIHVSRQGSDYRFQGGDVAAIIAQPTCYIKDVKSSGTAGGTFTSGSWQTRDLNTTSGDCTFLSLSSNQFTLSAGVYLVEASAPAFAVGENKAKIRNITTSTDQEIGESSFASVGYSGSSRSTVTSVLTITSTQTFELQHQGTTTKATNGLGVASTFGVDEVYAQVKITKVK